MARTTISDALPKVSSRYELGMLASQRVRDLNGGAELVIDDNVKTDKPTVTALREIASGKLDVEELRHTFVQTYKQVPKTDEIEGIIESKSDTPELRELDAELEDAIIESDEAPAEEIADVLEESVPESEEVIEDGDVA
ncbi:MAG: DNA-directed RNA polymerase subunit omega [Alphaproteobacteria bacterium]|nr:DNA-directed RNA polymerase subunit omega [Alphaproteobacteria bacterium]